MAPSKQKSVTCRHCEATLYQVGRDTAIIISDGEGVEVTPGAWAEEVTGVSCPGTDDARHEPSYTLRLPARVAQFLEGTQVYADMNHAEHAKDHDAEQVATFTKVFGTAAGSRGERWLTGLTDDDLDELAYQADILADVSTDDARWNSSARADRTAALHLAETIRSLRPHHTAHHSR
jgi:hypothetical protein